MSKCSKTSYSIQEGGACCSWVRTRSHTVNIRSHTINTICCNWFFFSCNWRAAVKTFYVHLGGKKKNLTGDIFPSLPSHHPHGISLPCTVIPGWQYDSMGWLEISFHSFFNDAHWKVYIILKSNTTASVVPVSQAGGHFLVIYKVAPEFLTRYESRTPPLSLLAIVHLHYYKKEGTIWRKMGNELITE